MQDFAAVNQGRDRLSFIIVGHVKVGLMEIYETSLNKLL